MKRLKEWVRITIVKLIVNSPNTLDLNGDPGEAFEAGLGIVVKTAY